MPADRRPRLLLLLIAADVLAVALVVAIVWMTNRPTDPAVAPSPTSTPTDQQSPATSPTPQPSPTPTETADAAPSEVAVGPDGFEIVSNDGTSVFTYRWTDDASEAVAELTEAFGAEPTETILEGDGSHFPDYASYDWDGFALRDMIPSEGGKSRDEYFIPSFAAITANEVNGIAVVAEFGVSIGQSADEVRALEPDREIEQPDGAPRFFFAIDRADAAVEGEVYGYSPWVDTEDSAVVLISYRPYSEL